MTARDVWVTGFGAYSAAGVGAGPLSTLLTGGESGVHPLSDLAHLPAGRAPTPAVNKHARRLDRAGAMFFAAAEEAWADAGLPSVAGTPGRYAVIEGSSLGPLSDILTRHAERVGDADACPPRPSALVRFMPGAAGAAIAHVHGIAGPVFHLSAGSVSAMSAIGEAYERVASGRLDVAIAGGAECPLHPEIVAHFRVAGILAADSDGPARCLPFDRRRAGTVLGEGAGALILESEDHARRRGANPRAILRGFGFACEAYSLTEPDPAGGGVSAAVHQAMGDIPLREIGWIKAHGTGTRVNDAAEMRGLAAVFGAALRTTPVTSLKPALGHALGASGALETVAVVLALAEQIVPGTIGSDEIDPQLPLCHVPTRAEASLAPSALVLAEGFGGRCAALLITHSFPHRRPL